MDLVTFGSSTGLTLVSWTHGVESFWRLALSKSTLLVRRFTLSGLVGTTRVLLLVRLRLRPVVYSGLAPKAPVDRLVAGLE